MRKFLFVLLIIFLMFGGYILYDNYFSKKIPILNTEDDVVNVEELYIYGNHLNINGKIVNAENLDLVLYNGDFISYKINIKDNNFNMSDYVNDGIKLEDIPKGIYYAFIRSTTKDDDDKESYKYYVLNNNTKYEETIYYAFSNNGNKIVINSDNDYHTLMLNITENNDENIYDVIIDPGHGGMDSGAIKNGYKESELTMKIAANLKKKMEANGIKVKLTREEGQLNNNEKLIDYGTNGRAVISGDVHAKYLFSIHLNSNAYSSVNGVEVYTPANINYDFAKSLATAIVNNTGCSYSTNKLNKQFDGIYTRSFTEADIKSSMEEYAERNMNAYDITTKSNYFYMIREPGAIITGAYVDDRNSKIGENKYYNSNVGTEAYLLELAYLSNMNDLNNILNNMDKYTDAIANSFNNVFELKK